MNTEVKKEKVYYKEFAYFAKRLGCSIAELPEFRIVLHGKSNYDHGELMRRKDIRLVPLSEVKQGFKNV